MRLTFHTYSGMAFPITDGHECDIDDAREAAADYIWEARKRGHDVAVLQPGREWEIQTESNREGLAVTDSDGILAMHEVDTIYVTEDWE